MRIEPIKKKANIPITKLIISLITDSQFERGKIGILLGSEEYKYPGDGKGEYQT